MTAEIRNNPVFTRRRLLAGAGGLAAMAGATSLVGCSNGGSGSTTNNASVNASVKLPTYVPYTGLKPDLPGTAQGVDNAFRNFPKDNPQSVKEKPGDGSTVTGMAIIYYAVPPSPPKNSYWKGLNDRMNIDLQLQMVGNADYHTKFPTVVAGNDLPDLLMIDGLAGIPNVADFPTLADKLFQPLDEFLAGDAIKDYPNLANIPTESWKSAIFNGHIYGIPIPRGVVGCFNFIRQDLFEAKGLPTSPKGYDELISVCKELTDPKQRHWAFSTIGQPANLLAMINNEPNGWREDGGKLTHRYESQEYKQSINDLISMWKMGILHPNAFDTAQPFKNLFNAGTCAINAWDGYPGWAQYRSDNASNPKFKLGLMETYSRDGSKLAPWHLGSGVFGSGPFTAMKKTSDKNRIKMILRVQNYLAAPFGTEEYLYRLFGQEGVDHQTNSTGDPVLTKTGQTNTVIPVRYLADAPYTLYQPGHPEDADTQHEYESKEVPTGIKNPTVGLFSNAATTQNATADKNFNDGVNDIIQGRKPFSDLDSLISTWKSAAGDAMRKEYQDQLQKNGGK